MVKLDSYVYVNFETMRNTRLKINYHLKTDQAGQYMLSTFI